MSDLTITVSGCTGSGKSALHDVLRKFLQQEGYTLTGVDDVVEFLKEGQKTEETRLREQRMVDTVKEHAKITLKEETMPNQQATEILKQIRERQASLDAVEAAKAYADAHPPKVESYSIPGFPEDARKLLDKIRIRAKKA